MNIEAELRSMWSHKLSYEEMGRRLGVNRQTVARHALELGLIHVRANAWSKANDDHVTKLWLEGHSASEIAATMLGRTRNAIIGRVCRLGLQRTAAVVERVQKFPSHNPAARKPRAPIARKVSHKPPRPGQQNRPGDVFGKVSVLNPAETEKQRQKHRAYGQDAVSKVATGADVESPNARPWMERKAGECKWPLGERFAIRSCCNPVERGGYCEGHAAVAFTASTLPTSNYISGARFDRIDYLKQRKGPGTRQYPTTPWDEARAA